MIVQANFLRGANASQDKSFAVVILSALCSAALPNASYASITRLILTGASPTWLRQCPRSPLDPSASDRAQPFGSDQPRRQVGDPLPLLSSCRGHREYPIGRPIASSDVATASLCLSTVSTTNASDEIKGESGHQRGRGKPDRPRADHGQRVIAYSMRPTWTPTSVLSGECRSASRMRPSWRPAGHEVRAEIDVWDPPACHSHRTRNQVATR